MADKTAADRLQDLLDRAPKEQDYMKSRTVGSGKNVRTTQALDKPAFDAATQRFQDNYGSSIKALQVQLGHETTQSGLATEAATQRADYLKGPMHAAFSDYAAVPPLAGTLGGYGLARLTTPRALPGASPLSRAALMTGPLAEAALGPIVDAVAHRAQGDNPTARGQDVTGAVGNFGLGESAGAVAGGLYQAMGGMGRNVKGDVPSSVAAPPLAAAATKLPSPPPKPGEMSVKDAAAAILKSLGAEPTGSLTTDRSAIRGAYPNASPEVKAALAAANPKLKTPDAITKGLSAHWKSKFLIPLAAMTGVGAALSPDESEASSVVPEMTGRQAAMLPSELIEPASRGQQAIDTALRAARKVPGAALGAADTASYMHPLIGTARTAYDTIVNDAPFFTSPEEAMAREDDLAKARNLAHAQAEDARQRAALKPRREEIGAKAATATPKNGGVSDYRDVGVGGEGQPSAYVPSSKLGFDPADLPEYERSLLEKGIHPSEAAMHLMPHARAGAEAVKRGEDFWGGTDQFERERAALSAFYNMANRAADVATEGSPAVRPKASPPSALPAPPIGNDDIPMRARGGPVLAPSKARTDEILKLYAGRAPL
jgi:hypothetical protein